MKKYAFQPAIFYFLTALLLFSANPIFGSSRWDRDLARADQLINNLQYDEAIQILTEVARSNPNHFDRVQQRFHKIYQIQDEFNRVANELIETIVFDPENSEKILALSSHLYTLEHGESPIMLNFVTKTRELAQFNVNRSQLRDLMDKGRALLDNGDSYAAMIVYSEGLGFMRNEFFDSGLSTGIYNDIRRETANINSMIASFRQTGEPLITYSSELIAALNANDLIKASEITEMLIPAMNSFIELKKTLYASVNVFDRVLAGIKETNPDMGDRNHLVFVSMLIHGREDESIQEGMLGAFDILWDNSVKNITNAVTKIIEGSKNNSIRAFDSENYSAIASYQKDMKSYSDINMLYLDKNRELFAGGNPQTVTLYEKNVLSADIGLFIELSALNEANNMLAQAAQTGLRREINNSIIRRQEGNVTIAEAYRNEQQIRENIYALQREIETIASNGRRLNAEMNEYYSVAHITQALNSIEKMNGIFLAEMRRSAVRYYTIAYNDLEIILAARRDQLRRSRNYLDGITQAYEDGTIAVYRYPSEAFAELSSMNAAAAADIQNANVVVTQYGSEPAEIASAAEVSNIFTRYQAALNELTAIRAQGLPLADTARSRAAQAETYMQEGERIFREAQLAYQRRDYETAWDRLERASVRLNDSLDIQASAALRDMRDTQLVGLGISIAEAQNAMIIAEVRALVDSARNSYFNGNFQLAEDSLLRARNRWRVTNPSGENDEVVYWLGIVRTALSASTGRVISPTAPLYSEMSQLLSQAQRNYEDGVRYVNAGQRTLGLTKFDEARLLTMEVKLIYPVNQEAGLLDLRIEQFIDPVAFNTSFAQRLQAAVAGTRNRSLEAFADLQNLAEINPRYPNIRAIITQAEIDMGFRPPPPNPANLARSRELTASASRIVDLSLTAQYEVALRQLNEAITLNPDNAEAGRVRDRLLSRMSVPGTIVLTSEDEENYQRALRELNAGNNLVAFALVERLMLNPRNRNVQKVIELHQRIQSIL